MLACLLARLLCLQSFFAILPDATCYAFWIKGVSILITLLKEYTICNHGRQSVLVLSHNFQVHYLALSLSLSLSLSRHHYSFFLCFFLLASACELEKEAVSCVPFVSIGTEKVFFNFYEKMPRVSVSLDSESAAGECQ